MTEVQEHPYSSNSPAGSPSAFWAPGWLPKPPCVMCQAQPQSQDLVPGNSSWGWLHELMASKESSLLVTEHHLPAASHCQQNVPHPGACRILLILILLLVPTRMLLPQITLHRVFSPSRHGTPPSYTAGGFGSCFAAFPPPFFWLTAARYEPYVSCGWKAELITHRDRAARSASLCKTRSHLLPGIRQHRGFFPRKVGASKAARWPCWHGRQHPPATREMLWVAKQHLGNKIQGQWVREGKDGPLSAPSAGWEPVHSARFGSGVVAGSK